MNSDSSCCSSSSSQRDAVHVSGFFWEEYDNNDDDGDDSDELGHERPVSPSTVPCSKTAIATATASPAAATRTTTVTDVKSVPIHRQQPERFIGNRHRVLQTLVVLSMTLLQQKVTSAVAAAGAVATAAAADSSPTVARRLLVEDSDDLLVTTHDDDEEEDFLANKKNNNQVYDSLEYEAEEEVEDRKESSTEEEEDDDDDSTDILIVSTADGTLMGLSKSTGDLIWKQTGKQLSQSHQLKSNGFKPRHNSNNKDNSRRESVSESPSLSLLDPLVMTTTTAKTFASREDWRTAAVPSLDGKTVYLTGHVVPAAAGGGPSGAAPNDNAEITVTTSIPDLVHRCPFVDNRGRIYNGSRSSVAVAVDGNTGQILKVISTNAALASPSLFDSEILEQQEDDEHASTSDDDTSWNQGPGRRRKPKKKRKVVWMGRVDHTISIHEPRSGNLDVQFSAAEIKSVRDMILGQSVPEDQPPWEGPHDAAAAHLFLSAGTTTTTTADSSSLWKAVTTTPPPSHTMETCLVATPNGNLAYRNPITGEIDWVSPVRFDAPVAFAMDANSGVTLPVDIVPDTPMKSSDSADYLTREIHRQYNNLLADAATAARTSTRIDPLVGILANTDQLFAMPLGHSLRRQQHHHRGLLPGGPATASSSHTKSKSKQGKLASLLSSVMANKHTHYDTLQQQQRPSNRRTCSPGMEIFPSCLVSSSSSSSSNGANFIQTEYKKAATSQEQQQQNALVPFRHETHDNTVHDEYIPPRPTTTPPQQRKYQKILRILGSWLPPTLAMIFVVSFELGRRKRQKEQAAEATTGAFQSEAGGVIQVNQNVILGYGGHGTVVYEGMLEGRKVAVKRMLQAYHASADREISLLIESDGHPNVVRYFLKEVRGDFVYLALELCDLSLHELIGHMGAAYELMQKENWFDRDKLTIPNAVRTVLLQIATGVKHLHSLRIVHRDLKPANILLADSRKSKRKGDMMESVFEIFMQGDYVAKISDMGLGKQLVGQSSYGPGESSLRLQASNENGEAGFAMAGPGPGSVGWQAPEVMVMRIPSSDASVRSDNSGGVGMAVESFVEAASPLDIATRTSRSVDIFSLGCIFYSTLVPGSHPFGEWYEREANIMHNKPYLEPLREISIEAFDLVSSMIKRNPAARPTGRQVCDHPYFWSSERRLLFLCDFSDRLETEAIACNDEAGLTSTALNCAGRTIVVERNAVDVVGTAWDTALDDDLVSNVQKFRTYDPSSVRDLLRLIRNKYHHFEELPDRLRMEMGTKTEGLSVYFENRFPALLIHCFNVCREILSEDDPLCAKYFIPPFPKLKSFDLSTTIPEASSDSPELSLPPILQESGEPSDETEQVKAAHEEEQSIPSKGGAENPSLDDFPAAMLATPASQPDFDFSGCSSLVEVDHVSTADAGDVIVWECSTAAKTFNNRGWFRSDDDWVRRTDAALRKPSTTLIRCMDDAKFRTRLCNHWDSSEGTFCPMRKKGKCVFAHGPVELRVKEAKRNRWGKLVDDNGDNNNPRHSGGEDTYGAARSIETERKQEGKWNTEKGAGPAAKGGKKVPNAKKKDPAVSDKDISTKGQSSKTGKDSTSKMDCQTEDSEKENEVNDQDEDESPENTQDAAASGEVAKVPVETQVISNKEEKSTVKAEEI